MTRNTEKTSEQSACPKNYKPWVWTLAIMALLTLVWALFEGYQEKGVVRSFIEGNKREAFKRAKSNTGAINSAGMPAPVKNLQSSYHEIIESVRPAVISIDAVIPKTQMNNVGVPNVNYTRIGSGVIIDPRGYVLSSYHVIAGANSLRAIVYGKAGFREYTVKVVNANRSNDLVLLRIQGNGPFPHAALGDSDAVRTGDVVFAMGSPFGFDQTITTGIVSSRHRSLQIGGRIYEDIIQTDASINKGNSGGPLVNVHGEVISINTAIYSPTGAFIGIGFAIPINKAESLVAGILDFRNSPTQVVKGQIGVWTRRGSQMGNSFKLPQGRSILPPHNYRGRCLDCHPQLLKQVAYGSAEPVPRNNMNRFQQVAALGGINVVPSIGVSLIEVDSVIARQFGLLHPSGVLVDRVLPGTPAEGAGLSRGDIIVRADRRKVRKLNDFIEFVNSKKVGSKLELVVIRNGKRKTIKIRIAPASSFMPTPQQRTQAKQPAEFDWLGAEISPLSPTLKPYVNTGVYVADVEGILAAAGVKRGDIIQGINRDKVSGMSSFIKFSMKADIQKGFLLDIIRSGNPIYIKVKG